MTFPGRGHVESRILASRNEELTEPEATRVREHLRACADCRRVARELDAVRRVLDSDVSPEPSGRGAVRW